MWGGVSWCRRCLSRTKSRRSTGRTRLWSPVISVKEDTWGVCLGFLQEVYTEER
ncbi:hypothetical protein Hanom_Chr10g00900551 [Helianthus anomalus]